MITINRKPHVIYIATTSICTLCDVVVNVSAKVTEDYEITPQTQYVDVYANGECEWYPRFEQSETHCEVDVRWFPFDAQKCNVVFKSWISWVDEINININDDMGMLSRYLQTDEWDVSCKYRSSKVF